jgi:hypothetical protein
MITQEQQLVIDGLDVASARPVFIGTDGGNYLPASDYKAVWNMSKNELGCIASDGYNIIQHREVVASLFEALNNLNLKFTHKLHSQGHRIFLDIDFPETKLNIQKGEEFICGLRIINSYDKTTGLMILPWMRRMICSNGMMATTLVAGFSIRHNQKMVESLSEIVEKALNSMINSSDKLKAVVNNCMADSIEWNLAKEIMQRLVGREKHVEAILEILKKSGVQSVNRWQFYNALTNYATHGAQLKPSVEMWLQNKAIRAMETPFAKLNEMLPILEVKAK